jgi:hypothetical protein
MVKKFFTTEKERNRQTTKKESSKQSKNKKWSNFLSSDVLQKAEIHLLEISFREKSIFHFSSVFDSSFFILSKRRDNK